MWQLPQSVYNSFPYTLLSVFVIHCLDDWLEAFPNSYGGAHLLTRPVTSHQLRSMGTLRFPTKSSPLRHVDLGNMSFYSSWETWIITYTVVTIIPCYLKKQPYQDYPCGSFSQYPLQRSCKCSSPVHLCFCWPLCEHWLCCVSFPGGCEQFLHSR